MEKRQIILLVLAGLVLLYAGSDYFFSGTAAPDTGSAAMKKKQAQLENELKNIEKIIGSAKLKALEMRKVELAATDLKSLPVYTSKKPFFFEGKSSETTSTDVEGQPVVYSGYIEYDGRKYAILNGIEYAGGEDFAIPNYKVSKITNNHVVLERPGEMRGQYVRVKIPIKEDETGGIVKIRTVK